MDRKMTMDTQQAIGRHAFAAFHNQVTSQIAAAEAFIAQLDTCDGAEIEHLIAEHVEHARTVMKGCTGLIPDDYWELMDQEAKITLDMTCSEGRDIYIRCYDQYLGKTGEIPNVPAEEQGKEPNHPILSLIELTRELTQILRVIQSVEQKLSNADAS